MPASDDPGHRPLRSFGRIKSRAIKPRQAALFDTLLPGIALPDASLDRVMILFPDPWHKARHNKRRLVQAGTAAEIARLLKPGGRLRFVTDWKDYADWALETFERTPGLIWEANEADDWRVAPPDHVVTRYEEKKLGDTAPIFLDFTREA